MIDLKTPHARVSASERDEVEFGQRVYDKDTPVRPAWDGESRVHGVSIWAGRAHAERAVTDLLNRQAYLAVDIETSGVSAQHRHQIKCVSVATHDLAVVLDPRDQKQAHQIRRVLAEAPGVIAHNCSFDIPLIVGAGLATDEIVERVFDTIIFSRLADPSKFGKHGLGHLSEVYLGWDGGDIAETFKAQGYRTKGAGFLYSDIDSPAYLTGAAMDAAATARLAPVLFDKAIHTLVSGHPFGTMNAALDQFSGYGVDRDGAVRIIEDAHIVQRVMLYASIRGYKLDDDALDAYMTRTEQKFHAARQTLEDAGIRPGNGSDVIKLVDESGNLPGDWKRTPSGILSATQKDFEKLTGHPLAAAHLTYKGIEKMRRDYLDKLWEYADFDGRVHPQVGVLAAVTGRMSASNPPVQQFPEDARPMIVADDPGGWVSIDYSAVEPLVAAYSSGEYGLAHEITHGGDAYVPVAKWAGLIPSDMPFEQAKESSGRKKAKVVFLALLYGTGRAALATQLGMSEDEAQELKDRVLASIPSLKVWMDSLRNTANRTGLTMTAAGRIAGVERDPKNGKWKGYQAQNFYHQGSAYDLLSDGIVELHRQGLAKEVRFAIHDELVVTKDASAEIQHIMSTSSRSLTRFLRPFERQRREFFGTTDFVFPTDTNELPTHWKKV